MPSKTDAEKEKARELNRLAVKKYRQSHPETAQKWRERNREKIREYQRRWKKSHPESKTKNSPKYQKEWREKNPGKVKAYIQKWVSKNKPKINAKERERMSRNPSYKLARYVRARVRGAIRANLAKKSDRTFSLIGCDVQFLMGYLEARFKTGMKWSNYGTVWEIDHRIPCASFDLTDESHQRSCFNYSNLQPLFVIDNRIKHDHLPEIHQAELI